MIKVKFLNSSEEIITTMKRVSHNVIEIFDTTPNTSGFYLMKEDGSIFGNCSDYTTIYRETESGVQYSNDGSVYKGESTDPDIVWDELQMAKEQKIRQLNLDQQSLISNGCDVQLSDGTTEHFTLTQNDQLSLNSLSVKVIEGLVAIPWHTSDEDEGCRFYTEEDMKIITDTCANFVTWHVTWFRDLRRYIRSLTSKEEVQAITYETNIPMEYRSEVLQALMVQKAV